MPLAPSNRALLRHWPTPPLHPDCIGNTWCRSCENSVCPPPPPPPAPSFRMETFATFSDAKSREFARIECTGNHIIYHCMKSKNNILLYREFHRGRLFLYKQQKKLSMVKVTRLLLSWKDPVNAISKDWVETEEGDEGSFGALPSFPLSCTIWPRLFKLSTG